MEAVLRKLRIHSLREQLKNCQNESESFAEDFGVAETFEQKVAFAHRWERAIRETYAMQYLLDRLEREERDGRLSVNFEARDAIRVLSRIS